jgi:hypothetical protein
MSVARRLRAPLLAAACLVAAAVLVLLALDARAWSRTLTHDDLRFRALHGHTGLWSSPALLPGDPAQGLLGLSEPLAYRHALQRFWFSRVGADPETRLDLPTIRVQAQTELDKLTVSGRSAGERSTAANLLGVLTITTPATDSETQMQTIRRAADYFQLAVDENPANAAAKQNLELVLRLKRPGKSKLSKDARGGFGFGTGRGSSVIGGGY